MNQCPCGARIEHEDEMICKPCWLSAPAYWRMMYHDTAKGKANQARALVAIQRHAARRRKVKV